MYLLNRAEMFDDGLRCEVCDEKPEVTKLEKQVHSSDESLTGSHFIDIDAKSKYPAWIRQAHSFGLYSKENKP